MYPNSIRDYSSFHHHQHHRRNAVSDSELSLPSVRLRRSESFGSSLLSSHSYAASEHVIGTAPPFLSSRTYSGTPPSAPPALRYSASPYAPIPLPSQSDHSGPILLHPLLWAPSNHNPYYGRNPDATAISTTALDLDLSSSPQDIHSILMIAATAGIFAPATQPSLPSMTITHPLLPWFITVHRTVSGHVTVLDVLHTICRELNKTVTRSHHRHRQSDNGWEAWEERQRIEFLEGRHRFRGLREVEGGEDVWELVTE